MFLMGVIPADLYLEALAVTGRKERGLPCTYFLCFQWLVIVAHGIEHDCHDRIYVMGRRALSNVLNAQFPGYRRP